MQNNGLSRALHVVLLAGVVATSAPLVAQTQTPADNTKVNTRDRAKDAVTADQQKETATDRALTQKIRQALMDDKSLSTYAHNVKVVTQAGTVTLKGPVRSAAEKQKVEAKALEIAGAGHVDNQMSVAPEDTKPVKK